MTMSVNTPLDVARIQADFPILKRQVHGKVGEPKAPFIEKQPSFVYSYRSDDCDDVAKSERTVKDV